MNRIYRASCTVYGGLILRPTQDNWILRMLISDDRHCCHLSHKFSEAWGVDSPDFSHPIDLSKQFPEILEVNIVR